MRAVRLHGPGDLRVEEVETPPAPGPGQVLVGVALAGICGSDLHNYRTGAWISRAPSVAGHEFTGRVCAVGTDVRHVAPGDRVYVDSRYLCGTCAACRAGLGQVCENLGFIGEAIDGGFAEAALLPAGNVGRAPEGVPYRHLAMAEPLAVALHAVTRLQAPEGAPVIVTGCGPIGALVAILAARTGNPVMLIDRDAGRRALVADIVGGQEADLDGDWGREPPRHAIDTTGAPAVISTLIERLGGGGGLALVGIGEGQLQLDPVKLVEKDMSLVGCHAFADELAPAVAMLANLEPALDRLITAPIDLDAVPQAYQRQLSGEPGPLKVLIACGGDAP